MFHKTKISFRKHSHYSRFDLHLFIHRMGLSAYILWSFSSFSLSSNTALCSSTAFQSLASPFPGFVLHWWVLMRVQESRELNFLLSSGKIFKFNICFGKWRILIRLEVWYYHFTEIFTQSNTLSTDSLRNNIFDKIKVLK